MPSPNRPTPRNRSGVTTSACHDSQRRANCEQTTHPLSGADGMVALDRHRIRGHPAGMASGREPLACLRRLGRASMGGAGRHACCNLRRPVAVVGKASGGAAPSRHHDGAGRRMVLGPRPVLELAAFQFRQRSRPRSGLRRDNGLDRMVCHRLVHWADFGAACQPTRDVPCTADRVDELRSLLRA